MGKNLTQILWENEQIFGGVEGIVFADKIVEVEYLEVSTNPEIYQSQKIGETTLEAVLKTYPPASTVIHEDGMIGKFPDPSNILEIGIYISTYKNSPLAYQNGNFFWGAGMMGQDGFIAYIDNENNFVWSMMFDINPIISGKINGNYLELVSDNNHEVRINLNDLTDIEMKMFDFIANFGKN